MVREAFDSETLHILGNAMDQAWRRVKFNQLNGRACGVLADWAASRLPRRPPAAPIRSLAENKLPQP
jgi:hypothetical protein